MTYVCLAFTRSSQKQSPCQRVGVIYNCIRLLSGLLLLHGAPVVSGSGLVSFRVSVSANLARASSPHFPGFRPESLAPHGACAVACGRSRQSELPVEGAPPVSPSRPVRDLRVWRASPSLGEEA